jgi:signal transduction histidine kinase
VSGYFFSSLLEYGHSSKQQPDAQSQQSMKQRWYQGLVEFSSQLLRTLFSGWSLERKSLLFFAVALIVPIGLAFWFVLQMVAKPLVMQTTRQAARDYAKSVIAWRHVDRRTAGPVESVIPGNNSYFSPEALAILRKDLVDNPDYRHEFLMLDTAVQHVDLRYADLPTSEREDQLLRELEASYRERLTSQQASSNPAASELATPELATPELANSDASEPSFVAPSETGAGEALADPLRRPGILFRDDGPVFPELGSRMRFANETPPDGWYIYYHAVEFTDNCMTCHQRFQNSSADSIPFRVVKVLLPHGQTQVAAPTTLALMIAVAMVTVATTLLVIHWVLRRLVLNPLQHLRHVSDEVSRGNAELRAKIDTGDEFNELSDAFNRMLRHMIEGQDKLQTLNRELDIRVDQLAQLNLHLFEANRLKSDFLANMSHELRTPLNSILGFSDVLQDISSLNDKQKRYVSNIQNSGKLLLDMINDILDLAKVEAGKMEVTPSSFDVKRMVSSQCEILQSLIDEKNMDLRIECDPQLEDVFQDQSKIQQILTNLLSNAIKFTPDGGLITVSVSKLSERYFTLTVADTGVGIPEGDFEIIFEKFRQSSAVLSNDGLTRQHPGTGLGLSIVKELCKLLGGEVRLSSQLGTGSVFQVVLPKHYEQIKANGISLA